MNADLIDFRGQVDDFMQHHPQSPLDWQQKQDFTAIDYYPENEDLILEVEVERLPDDEPLIEMTTNTGDIRPYRRWGKFSFTVDGEEAALVIYSDAHGHEFSSRSKIKLMARKVMGRDGTWIITGLECSAYRVTSSRLILTMLTILIVLTAHHSAVRCHRLRIGWL